MKKVATAISLFTLLPVFSLAATGLTNLEENITRAVVNSVSNSQQQTKMSYDAVLKIMKDFNGCDYKFNDKHTKIRWYGSSFDFKWTSDGFALQGTGLNSGLKINCGIRLDGFYSVAYRPRNRKCHKDFVANKDGRFVNKQQILTNYRDRNLNSLNRIEIFNKMNKDMIASILAAYGVYAIDYGNEGEVSYIYGDALDKNIEIKFIKQDNKTIYGTLFVSKNNTGNSETYAFRYSDQTTPNKQRVKIITKRVGRSDLNEQNPNTKKYMEFLSEGAVHTTYTKVNGKLYKNQKELF